jgi:hypothetical protein
LLIEVQEHSAIVIEKLLSVASSAAAAEESHIVSEALATLNFLLKSPGHYSCFYCTMTIFSHNVCMNVSITG